MFWQTSTTARGRVFARSRPERTATRRHPIWVESLEDRTLLNGDFLGAQGTVVTPFFGAEADQAERLLVQPDGKLVAIGISGNSVSLARYESSGALDPTFGRGGKVTTSFPSNQVSANSAALQSDQKILVDSTLSGVGSNVLLRYTTAGSLDPSFGSGGKVEVKVLAGASGGSVAVLPNGEIVVAGSVSNSSNTSFVVAEYEPNGTPDTSFGNNGSVTTNIGSSGVGVAGITAQGNNIIVAGYASNDLVVARYTAAGALDGSFGKGGLASYPAPGSTYGVATAPDGSILVVGNYFSSLPTPSWSTFVTHLTANGTLDATYGNGGTATLNGFFGRAIAVQPDGKAVVAETAGFALFTQAAAARFTTSGTPDISFGSDGVVTTPITTSDTIYAVALQPANPGTKIVIAGRGFNEATGNDFELARYTASGALDASFGSGGSVTTNFVGSVDAQANSIVSDGHGGFLVAGTTGSAGGSLAVADYGPDGRLNRDFGHDGKVQVTFNSYIFGSSPNDSFVAVQKDGKILLVGNSVEPGTTNYDFAIARLLPDGTLDPSFGVGGKVTTFSGAEDTDMAPSGGVVIQPDGKILVAGYTEDYGHGYLDKGVVVRYNKDGSLDTTFGTDGRETIELPPTNGEYLTMGFQNSKFVSMALEPNGEILLGGYVTTTTYSQVYVLEKLQSNGTPDSSFGPLGDGEIVEGGVVGPLLLRPDGTILVGGTTFDSSGQSYMTVAQFTAAGTPDSSFGNDGQASVGFAGNPNYTFLTLANMALQRNGEVTVVGTFYNFTNNPTTSQVAVARFTAAGKVDTGFGNNGTVLTSVLGYQDSGAAVLVQNDGRIVVAGSTYDTATLQKDFALLKYNSDGTLIVNP